MKKLSKYQIIGLRQVYDFDTVMKINNNIINLINSYTKKHNLKGWKKKFFIKEINGKKMTNILLVYFKSTIFCLTIMLCLFHITSFQNLAQHTLKKESNI